MISLDHRLQNNRRKTAIAFREDIILNIATKTNTNSSETNSIRVILRSCD